MEAFVRFILALFSDQNICLYFSFIPQVLGRLDVLAMFSMFSIRWVLKWVSNRTYRVALEPPH